MSKHPTPKKKTAKAASKQRYGSFKTRVLKKLTNRVTLTKCPDCDAKIPAHTACPECGKYRGRQVIDKQKAVDKITKIKA
ncbi:50S ribosomal protein L32 [Candidatus Peregrinibacteria bacterium]|jgi:large subunit ribosomal protein L32|nr:50S ribosomal protein L32 [Candidatus Peregrinibacteria bacterium]